MNKKTKEKTVFRESREKRFVYKDFLESQGYTVITKFFETGDYEFPNATFEIKQEDFYQSIFQNRERFERELRRAKEQDKKFYVLIETSVTKVLAWSYRSKARPLDVLKRTAELSSKYEIPFIFCDDSYGATRMMLALAEASE
jgi:ERCC4-type nuclease